MKIYQAGAMRGYENYNFDLFEEGQSYLQWLGHDVVSPHSIDIAEGLVHARWSWGPAGALHPVPWIRKFTEVWNAGDFDINKAMQRDLPEVAACDAISLLPGWERSSGATTELAVAKACGREVWLHEPWKYFRPVFDEDIGNMGCVIRRAKDYEVTW